MLFKIKLKSLLIYIFYNIILLIISYFLNRFLQMLIFILFFSFIQNCFNYRFHADTIEDNPVKSVRLCKIITIIVELLYLSFCNKLNISVYSNLFIIFVIAFLNCLLEFSIETICVKENFLKDKDKLLMMCKNTKLTKNATDRLFLKYIEGKTYQEIADLECVDVTTIKKSINRSRNKIFKSRN